MTPALDSTRLRRLAVACVLTLVIPAVAGAQSNWITRVPPERLLHWQPRTAHDFAHPEVLFTQEGGLTTAAPAVNIAPPTSSDPRWQDWGPPQRADHVAVIDSRRHRLIVLGGYWQLDPRASVWSYDIAAGDWSDLAEMPWASGVFYRPNAAWSAVYDSLRDRVLVLHSDGALQLDALDLAADGAWSHVWTGPTTSLSQVAGMAIDTQRDVLAILGVWDAAATAHRMLRVPLGDPTAWTSELTQGTQPFVPARGEAAYDPARDEFEVFFDPGDATWPNVPQVFALNASGTPTWTGVPLPAVPYTFFMRDFTLRHIALDAARDQLIVADDFGVALGVPLGAGAPQWLALTPAPATPRKYAALAFDPASRHLFLHGGSTNSPLTLAVMVSPILVGAAVDSGVPMGVDPPSGGSAAHWLADGDPGLDARWGHLGLLDPLDSRLIVYSGAAAFDEGQKLMQHSLGRAGHWEELSVSRAVLPPARHLEAVALDAQHQELVFFGGQDATPAVLADTWKLSIAPGGGWQRIDVAGPVPPARRNAALLYDAARSRYLLVGGDDLSSYFGDVWELRLSPVPAWRQLAVSGVVPPYEVLFADDTHGDAWGACYGLDNVIHLTLADDAVQFEVLPPSGTAPPTTYFNVTLAGFDPVQRRMFWFQDPSHGYAVPFTQMWTAMLGGATADWVPQSLAGPGPTPRGSMATVFDPSTSLLLLTGGVSDNGCYYGDLWALPLTPTGPTAAVVSLLDVTSNASGVLLRWQVGVAPGTTCQVERSADAVAWTQAGAASWSGAQEVRFTDAAIPGGSRVAYRLRVSEAGGDVVTAASWVSGPLAQLALSIAPASNPCRGIPAVRFSLPDGASARLRLLDVSGRQVAEARLQAGAQQWTSGSAMKPGLYFAELVQGGQRRVARVVVTP